jgi:hypothetical protein
MRASCGAHTIALQAALLKQNLRLTWHYIFSFDHPRPQEICGFQAVSPATTVEDGFDTANRNCIQ